MFRDPPFKHFSPPLKLLSLVMIMIITFLIVLAIGVAFSIPFFGKGMIEGISAFSDYSDPQTVVALKYFQIVNQVGVFILPSFLFVVLTDNNPTDYLKLDSRVQKLSVAFGMILLVVSIPFVGWLVDVNDKIHLPEALARLENWMRSSENKAELLTNAFLSTASWGGFLVNLLMIAVLAAVGEELIFRGILVRLFSEWTRNAHLAVIIPALLFSALHLQFYGFFGRFLLGMLLGYLFIWTGSLWVPVIVHFLNNALAVVVSFLDRRGVINTDLESFGNSGEPMVIIASALLMLVTLIVIYRHERGNFSDKIIL